jgi:hypothetical protein
MIPSGLSTFELRKIGIASCGRGGVRSAGYARGQRQSPRLEPTRNSGYVRATVMSLSHTK